MRSEAGEPRNSRLRLNAWRLKGFHAVNGCGSMRMPNVPRPLGPSHKSSFGADKLRAGAPQHIDNFLRGIAVKIDGNLDQAFQLLPPLRCGRCLDVRTCRACSHGVRSAGRLDEDVASRHAAFLHDMLNRKLGAAARVEFSNDGAFQGCSPCARDCEQQASRGQVPEGARKRMTVGSQALMIRTE